MKSAKIQANTRYAFVCIALMLLSFLALVLLILLPLGWPAPQLANAARAALYCIVVFTLLGAVFSIRVSLLNKQGC